MWAQAVEAAGSLDLDAVIDAMHRRQFDTVLGRIGFDDKGDVTGVDPWGWYVWQADGTYVPLEQQPGRGLGKSRSNRALRLLDLQRRIYAPTLGAPGMVRAGCSSVLLRSRR